MSEKCEVKFLLIVKKITMDETRLQKRGGFESPICLKLGSSCGDEEQILFSVNRLNNKLLLDRFKDVRSLHLDTASIGVLFLKKKFLSLPF